MWCYMFTNDGGAQIDWYDYCLLLLLQKYIQWVRLPLLAKIQFIYIYLWLYVFDMKKNAVLDRVDCLANDFESSYQSR